MPLVHGLISGQASKKIEIHVQVNDLLDKALSLSLGQSPPESLQSRAYLELLGRCHEEMLDFPEIQRSQVLETHHHILLLLLLLRDHGLPILESVLQLLLHGTHLLFKGVIDRLLLTVHG
jgi:hypothetical protein